MMGWLFDDKYYTSTADFRAAWEAGELVKGDLNLDNPTYWTNLDTENVLSVDEKPAPVAIQVRLAFASHVLSFAFSRFFRVLTRSASPKLSPTVRWATLRR